MIILFRISQRGVPGDHQHEGYLPPLPLCRHHRSEEDDNDDAGGCGVCCQIYPSTIIAWLCQWLPDSCLVLLMKMPTQKAFIWWLGFESWSYWFTGGSLFWPATGPHQRHHRDQVNGHHHHHRTIQIITIIISSPLHQQMIVNLLQMCILSSYDAVHWGNLDKTREEVLFK